MLTSPILQLSLDRYLCALIFGLFIGSIESGFAKGLNTFSTATHSPEGPLTVSFTTEGSCANTPVMFFPVVTPGADRVEWNFGDGNTSSAWAPTHRYGNSGVFLVELTAFLGDEVAHAFGQVNINANDLRLTLVPDTIACACNLPVNFVACGGAVEQFEVPVLSWGGNMPSFQWYGPRGILPDQTSNVLAPDSAGYYYVVATDGAGCSSYAGVSIREYDAPDRRNNLWYFGNGAGIVFDATNGMGAVAITGPLVTPGGSSVMSDRNKQPVLSTDGHQLLNGLSQDITPPGGLGGENNSTQSSLIIPVPGDETLYYIFATGKSSESGSEIRYALFDRKLNDGQGGLIASNLLLFSNSTGRITGNGEWLIAHELGNNSFRAYRVTPSGISDAVVSPIGSIVNETESHYMKLGGDNKLGVAISAGNAENWIEVFDFDAFSGKITNKGIGDLGVSSGQINGIEFFAGGNKIFATWSDGETSRIYEFAPHVPYRYHQLQWKDYEGEFGMIQNAPDGKLYVAVNGSTTIRRFAAAPDTAVVTNIVLEDFELAWTTTSTRGLPNTIIAPPLAMNFSVVNACAGQLTGFLATGKEPSIDKFDWSFGDGQSEIDAHPSISHLYTAAGNYTVVLTIRNKCQSPVTSITREITLSHPPPDPSTTVALCADPVILDANPQDIPDLTFAWSNTHTSETMEVNQPGSYVVVISTEFGCSTEATFIVADNTPFVNLGEDKSFCKGASVVLDAMNPGASYSWSVDGQPNGNGLRTQAVNTSASGVFIYSVNVTDPVTTCVGSDAVTYTIRDTPEFVLSSNSPIACNTASGQITISVLSPTTLFDYSVVGPGGTFSNTGDASNGPAFTPASLAEGTYSVTVTDQQSGCQNVDEINVYAALERPAISVDGDLLTSSSDDSNQWFKDGIQIAGATGRTYQVTQSGVYTVQVTIGECSALSLPVTVTITGLGEERLADMKVFPNPFRNTITIQLHESAVGAVVELFTVEGIRMQTVEVAMGERSISGEIDLVNYPSGIYILKVRLATGYKVVKLTKL